MLNKDLLKAILFDVGDTLYTNEEFHKAYRDSLYKLLQEKRGLTPDEAVGAFKQRREELKQQLNKFVTKLAVMKSFGIFRQEVHDAYFTIDPSIFLQKDHALSQTLEKLQKKYQLGILSNDQTRMIKKILAALGIKEEFFVLIQGEEKTKKRKPDPEPFFYALEHLGVAAAETGYVADSLGKDLKPAKDIGMQTILVGSTHDDLGVDASISSIYDLEKILL